MINLASVQLGPEEKKAVLEVLDSGQIAQGPRVKAFEEAFAQMCGVKAAVATSSGTTALHTALLAHNIGPGDEVITTPFSFMATVNSIIYTGAKPVLVDINPHTFNLDADQIERAITRRTKAIVPVHLYGLCADMEKIKQIADQHGLEIIEDAAQSHGASYKNILAGAWGTGVFSFYPTKNITSGEGGMITTNDLDIAERCRIIRQHGMQRRYYHDEIGFNYRLSDIHAAIGLEQLKKLARFNDQRRANAEFLSAGLKGVTTPKVPGGYTHVFHQYTIRVSPSLRDGLAEYLLQQGISTQIYYPVPIHKQKFFEKTNGDQIELFEAERAAKEVLSLPVHPTLSIEDLDTIINAINGYMENGH